MEKKEVSVFRLLFFLFSMENNNNTISTEKEEGSNMAFGSKMVFGRVFCFQYLDTIQVLDPSYIV